LLKTLAAKSPSPAGALEVFPVTASDMSKIQKMFHSFYQF